MIKMYEVRDAKDLKVYLLNEIADMYDDSDSEDYDYISRRLICPSCGIKITDIEIDDNTEIIRTKRKDHLFGCDFFGFRVDQKTLKKQLDRNHDLIKDVEMENKENKRFIPKKSIDRRVSVDDIDMIKYYYGEVTFRSAHSKDDSRYFNIAAKSVKGDIINLSFQGEALTKFKSDLMSVADNPLRKCDICFVGKLVEVDGYYNVVIKSSNFFKFINI